MACVLSRLIAYLSEESREHDDSFSSSRSCSASGVDSWKDQTTSFGIEKSARSFRHSEGVLDLAWNFNSYEFNLMKLTCFLSLSKKRELSNIAVGSDKNGDDDDASIDELFAEVNGRVVVEVLVRDVDQDISLAQVISERVDVLGVEVAEVGDVAVVFGEGLGLRSGTVNILREYLDDRLVDVTQEVTSRNGVDCLCEFKVAKSRVRHIAVVSDSDSVA